MWAVLIVAALVVAPAGQPSETIAAIQVHGNTATSDDEIKRLAGVDVGARFDATTPDEVVARLRATKRFDRVEALKRFASIGDPSQVLLVIIVDEGPVRIERSGVASQPPRVVRRHRLNLMVLPILGREDGYGMTYGVRLANPGVAGTDSRGRAVRRSDAETGVWRQPVVLGCVSAPEHRRRPRPRIVHPGPRRRHRHVLSSSATRTLRSTSRTLATEPQRHRATEPQRHRVFDHRVTKSRSCRHAA